ncbi:hypothetical protein JK2ML_1761 [Mycobacterium leprae Kyoto-2]|uniref:Uncharacterized protein n=3 Tax=Mycobacterium leprae TaxID=1769 RepID=Q9CBP0_MYCLE|nr:hypothetical protein [Mycobacterium leprae]CAR71856.1 hypothetical protein MLBr01761 [Mycobacterium leprae Br4923]AWV49089.1 hypothetical protein DIJ64_09700 [Mycobacterium leprae]OAR19966.1 hypothetical protein A8144_12670 [Mycobacterium leprae 3125609]OAX70333.1 hypothetical protein A3216_12635 [Mycobacterium leprae 7935681]CAC30714.1 hypothetical protein [Mycobacterium leprae]
MIEADYAAWLKERWEHFEHHTPLRVVNCPDYHLIRVAHELIAQVLNEHLDSKVTVLLFRRKYSPFLCQLLHDRTTDKMVRAVGLIRDAIALIMLDDIESRISRLVNSEGSSSAE